ncbi:triacylglycerol lipase [Naviculisporaceae sp. PSN 640]
MMDENSPTPPPPAAYPLHESIVDRIDPQYAAYYNEHLINQQPVHFQPLHISRASGILLPGASPLQPVASIKDYTIPRTDPSARDPELLVRVFTPLGNTPQDGRGWPVCLYFHGGGFVLGNIDTENVVCSHLCSRAKTVVVTVEYRLAPENPFPAAVNDAWDALSWLTAPETKTLLRINSADKLALAGSSCGATLAVVMCQRLTKLNIKPRLQLLSTPIMDNTLDEKNNPHSSWAQNQFAPALPAAKMHWFRNHYLPVDVSGSGSFTNRQDPEASPVFWKGDWTKLPAAIILLGELDILRDEGKHYGGLLYMAGVRADVYFLRGQPHCFLSMDGVLKAGEQAVGLLCERLYEVMYPGSSGDKMGAEAGYTGIVDCAEAVDYASDPHYRVHKDIKNKCDVTQYIGI